MIIYKTKEEIERMREGGRRLARILQELRSCVKVGVSELELNRLAGDLAQKNQGEPSFLGYRDYPANLCVSVNNEVVHGVPKNRTFNEGDVVSLDFGFLYQGRYTDSAITFGVGKISNQAQKLIEVTKKALEIGIAKVRAGNRLGDISFAIQNYVERIGFSVVRDLVGHGVGRKVHEDPRVPNFGRANEGVRLKIGMTLAIEPMVNVGTWKVKLLPDKWTFVTADGKLSAHFEHTVAITRDGCEILTKM